MDKKLLELTNSLEKIKSTVDKATINENGFQAHGWNQIHLKKENISYILSNFINKLKSYGDSPITEDLNHVIDDHIENINLLNSNAESHFNDNATHLLHSVPNILLTLNTIFDDIDYELFSYENIQNKKLLPKNLSARLRGTKTRLDSIDESSLDLEKKIIVINEAHEAAESLPTDLASLREAKIELEKLIKTATSELEKTKIELLVLKDESINFKNSAKKASEKAEISSSEVKLSANKAEKLVAECDDALQVTTTQGLAAGFDQKAKELNNSIWVWVIGLLIALGTGAWIGAERVEAFTQALSSPLTIGQAILHALMSIFSIGGSLWLAWISTKQINQRFKLSEDYSYKATVAKSFTGFKKLAERFDSSTEERLFNSTLDRFDEMPLRLIEGKDYNSPWNEFTDSESFKEAMSVFPNLAKEAGKFTNKTNLKKKPKQRKVKKEAIPEVDIQEPVVQSEKNNIST